MKAIIRLFIYFVLLSIIGCSSNESYKYYKNVNINSAYLITGKNPISKNELEHNMYYRFTYGAINKIIKIEYMKYGEISKDNYFGVSTIKIDYSKGSKKLTYFNSKGEPTANKYGYFAMIIYLTEKGVPKQVSYFGKNGKTVEDYQGIAKISLKYDNHKRVIENKFYGIDGNFTVHRVLGVPIIRWKYDDEGNIIEESYYGQKGELKERWYDNVALIQRDYDSRKNTIEERNYNKFRKLTE